MSHTYRDNGGKWEVIYVNDRGATSVKFFDTEARAAEYASHLNGGLSPEFADRLYEFVVHAMTGRVP